MLGYLSLPGCGGSGGGPVADAMPTPPASAANPGLFPVSEGDMASIRARPEAFLSVYNNLATDGTSADAVVRSTLGTSFASLSDAGCLVTFAAMVAHNSAPLGSTPVAPIPATLQQLLRSQAMACGHYCKLATMLSLLGHPELIPPDAATGSPAKPTVHILVWLQNVPLATGFHSQLIVSNVFDDGYLLLDPTYAYVLRIPFVGAGPQSSLTVIENAAIMLQTPIAAQNVAVLDPAGIVDRSQMLTAVTSGVLGPQYIYHDSLFGSEGWDTRIAGIFNTLI